MSECTHRKVAAWSAEDGEPVDFWSCADCGRRFEPLNDANKMVGADELEALRRDAAIGRMVRLKMTTGNDSESVNWCVITAADIDAAMEKQEHTP